MKIEVTASNLTQLRKKLMALAFCLGAKASKKRPAKKKTKARKVNGTHH